MHVYFKKVKAKTYTCKCICAFDMIEKTVNKRSFFVSQ